MNAALIGATGLIGQLLLQKLILGGRGGQDHEVQLERPDSDDSQRW